MFWCGMLSLREGGLNVLTLFVGSEKPSMVAIMGNTLVFDQYHLNGLEAFIY